MAKLKVRKLPWGDNIAFFCPGCDESHAFQVRTDGGQPSWDFNGDTDNPTFSPSLRILGTRMITDDERDRIMRGGRVEHEPFVCHLFLCDGQVQYLGDCTHHLAGKTAPLPEIEE